MISLHRWIPLVHGEDKFKESEMKGRQVLCAKGLVLQGSSGRYRKEWASLRSI